MKYETDWKEKVIDDLYAQLELIRENAGLNKKDFSTKIEKSLNWYHQCFREKRDLAYSDLKRIEEEYNVKIISSQSAQ